MDYLPKQAVEYLSLKQNYKFRNSVYEPTKKFNYNMTQPQMTFGNCESSARN